MKENYNSTKDINAIKEMVSKCQIVKIIMHKNNVFPLNYGYEFKNNQLILYCCCNIKGKKLDILDKNPNVSIEIDNESELIENNHICKNNSQYFSITSLGKVEFVYNIYDKIHGLNRIIEHDNLFKDKFLKNKSLNNISLIKIKCKDLSTKYIQ